MTATVTAAAATATTQTVQKKDPERAEEEKPTERKHASHNFKYRIETGFMCMYMYVWVNEDVCL